MALVTVLAVALLPALGWFLLVVLRWFGITEKFTVLESTIEGTGAAFTRGLVLFVALPLIAAAASLWASRWATRRRRIYRVLATAGVFLAVANILT